MALIINTEVQTVQGFKTNNCLVFVDIYLTKGGQWVNLTFFENKQSFKEGKEETEIVGLPGNIAFKIPRAIFWGDGLIMQIHEEIKRQFERKLGKNTVDIIQDPYS
jgi:hypothetical protein